MPIGTQLASKIGEKLDIRFELGGEHIGSGDLELFQHIRSAFRDNARDYQHVGWLIRDGMHWPNRKDFQKALAIGSGEWL